MSAEPALAQGALLRCLEADYGLDLDAVTFLPEGTAHAYRAEGRSGRFFVKVWPDTASGEALAERTLAEGPLLRALRSPELLSRVPRLLPTRDGRGLTQVGDFPLVVYDWIEARALAAGWTAALPELAPLLGRLHRGTPAILAAVNRLPVPQEDFGLPFGNGLAGLFSRLSAAGPDDRPSLPALRDLLLPHQPALERLLTRARSFQHAARRRAHPFVVCHTDAHGGNVMRDAGGDLWIIDWETARLAPAEHDLWMLHARLPEVLPAYAEAAGGPPSLDLDTLCFYRCRRVLEDLEVDLRALLRENTRPEQDTGNLAVIGHFILPSLGEVQQDLEQLKSAVPGR